MNQEPPEYNPDTPADVVDHTRPPGWRGKLGAPGLPQARRWMRWAWLAALAWWVWNTGLLLVWLVASVIPPEAGSVGEADPPVPARIIIYHGVEGFLIGMLGLGLNFRLSLAGLLLPAVFLAARIIALTRLEPVHFDVRGVVWVGAYLLLLFLFVRGAQGALSWHWHTRPKYPDGN